MILLKDAILAKLWTETVEGSLCVRAFSVCSSGSCRELFLRRGKYSSHREATAALNDATGRSRKAHTFKEVEVPRKSSCAGK